MTNPSKIKKFIRQEHKLNNKIYKQTKKLLKEIMIYIIQWNIDKIYLFGSVLHKKRFHYGSDIDIAVEGISFYKFSKLWFELELKFPLKIDLINLDDCDEYFKDAIKKRGKLVYEK